MKFTASMVITYSLVVLLGGLIGYLTANSLMSLIMGSISGAVLFASGLGLYRYSSIAFMTATGMTLLLVGFFSFRYFKTLVLFPSGMMAAFSFLILMLLLTTRGKPQN